MKKWNLAAVFIIVGIAIFVRFFKLDILPINHDEAFWTWWSVKESSPNEVMSYVGIPILFGGIFRPLFSFCVFISDIFLRNPHYILRIPAALIGSLTILLNYIFVKKTLSQKTAVFSSLWLAVLPWHVIFSRTGEEKILVPLFGIIIFYTLYEALSKKNKIFFILSCAFLAIGSFYTYQPAVVFVPIFLLSLLVLHKEFTILKHSTLIYGFGMFLLLIHPFIVLQINSKYNIIGSFYRFYHWTNIHDNFFIVVIAKNALTNISLIIKGLFFTPNSYFMYGSALKSPLLIHWISLILVIGGIIVALKKHSIMHKILLCWFIVSLFAVTFFINLLEARYLLIILPVPIILGADFLKYLSEQKYLKNIGYGLFATILLLTVEELYSYDTISPTHYETCRQNSYGCNQAAEYLLTHPDIQDSLIITDDRMSPLKIYLEYKAGNHLNKPEIISNALLSIKGLKTQKTIYYIIWAPESHPHEYWDGGFRKLYNLFKEMYPKAIPIHIISYPNNFPAIKIYKILSR